MPHPLTIYFSNLLSSAWKYLSLFKAPSVRIMLFLGFSAGIPLGLMFGTLTSWLNEAEVKKSTITYFSWVALGYGFKFVWAPLIDQVNLPFLKEKLGKRRAWLLVFQLLLLLTIALMAFVNPTTQENLTMMAFLAVALGFLSASQDIVIDAYRIEITPPHLMGMSSASYQLGYRLAMLASGAGALILSQQLGSELGNYAYDAWQKTYLAMSLLMLIGIVTTLLISEPQNTTPPQSVKGSQQLITLFVILLIPFIAVYASWNPVWNIWLDLDIKSLSPLNSFLFSIMRFIVAILSCFLVTKVLIHYQLVSTQIAKEAYLTPIKEFINRYPTRTIILLLLLIGFYRVSDVVLGVVAYLFYQDIGFSKIEFATASKFFGIVMIVIGTFIGGSLVAKIGTMTTMLWGAILASGTNLLFMLLAWAGNKLWLLYVVIGVDNLAVGIATTAFITFLSRLSNIQFTAMQYAIFSSVMLMLPKLLGGYSGTIIEANNYSTFFLITTLMGLPVIALVHLVSKRLTFDNE